MIEIRKLEPSDDFGDLIVLSREFFQEYQDHDEGFYNIGTLEDEHITSFFKRTVDSDNGMTYIALDGEKMVAYITVFIEDQAPFYQIQRCGHISGLMVSPNYRSRGIGKRLMDEALVYFKEKGVVYYKLFTSVNNESGIRFYESYGLKHFQTIMMGVIE